MGMPLKREVPVTAAIASALSSPTKRCKRRRSDSPRVSAISSRASSLGKLTTSRARSKPIG